MSIEKESLQKVIPQGSYEAKTLQILCEEYYKNLSNQKKNRPFNLDVFYYTLINNKLDSPFDSGKLPYGCDVHFMQALPKEEKDFQQYKGSYILCGNSLYCIGDDGKSQTVGISDKTLKSIADLNTKKASKIKLSVEKFKDLTGQKPLSTIMYYDNLNQNIKTVVQDAVEYFQKIFQQENIPLDNSLQYSNSVLETAVKALQSPQALAIESEFNDFFEFCDHYCQTNNIRFLDKDLKRKIIKGMQTGIHTNLAHHMVVASGQKNSPKACLVLNVSPCMDQVLPQLKTSVIENIEIKLPTNMSNFIDYFKKDAQAVKDKAAKEKKQTSDGPYSADEKEADFVKAIKQALVDLEINVNFRMMEKEMQEIKINSFLGNVSANRSIKNVNAVSEIQKMASSIGKPEGFIGRQLNKIKEVLNQALIDNTVLPKTIVQELEDYVAGLEKPGKGILENTSTERANYNIQRFVDQIKNPQNPLFIVELLHYDDPAFSETVVGHMFLNQNLKGFFSPLLKKLREDVKDFLSKNLRLDLNGLNQYLQDQRELYFKQGQKPAPITTIPAKTYTTSSATTATTSTTVTTGTTPAVTAKSTPLEPSPILDSLNITIENLTDLFEEIQNDLESAYETGGKEGLKSYKENRLQKKINTVVRQIQKQIESQSDTNSFHHENAASIAKEILRREHIQYLSTLYPKKGIISHFYEYTSSQTPVGEFQNCYLRWKPGLAAFRKHTFQKHEDQSFALSKFDPEDIKKLKELVGSDFPKIQDIEPEKSHYKSLSFKKEEILSIKDKLDYSGDQEAKKLSAKLVQNTLTLIEYYHHSSPVIYEEVNFKKRIEGTRENLKQALKEANGKNLTEIRLLSTFKGPGGDYQQVLETYFSVLLENENQKITLFVYGVNLVRLVPDKIQTYINTRSINELFEKIFSSLDIASEFQTTVDSEIIIQRNQLSGKINNLYKLGKNESEIKKMFLSLLKNHQIIEEMQYKKYESHYKQFCDISTLYNKKEHTLIKNDFDTFLKLRELVEPKYNGQIQAVLVRLNARLGEMVVTGCNDAKDRDGMVAITVEANEIYKDKNNGKYPDITREDAEGEKIREAFREIQIEVYEQSTPVAVAEYVSWPGLAKGLDNTNQPFSGFGHLPNEIGEMAGYFKQVYDKHGYSLTSDLSYTITSQKILDPKAEKISIIDPVTRKADTEFRDFHPGLQSIASHQKSQPGERKSDHVPILATIPLPLEFQTVGKKNLTVFSFNILGNSIDDGAFGGQSRNSRKEEKDYEALQTGVKNVHKNTIIDFSVFQENTQETKPYLIQKDRAAEHIGRPEKYKCKDFSECQNDKDFAFDKIMPLPNKKPLLMAVTTLEPVIERYQLRQKSGHYIQIWNVHAAYGRSPIEVEEAIKILLKDAQENQPDTEKVLHIFVGDFNRHIGPTLNDQRVHPNIGTAIDHPQFQMDREQGVAFPDGCFYAYLDGSKKDHEIEIYQADIEHINLKTGKAYTDQELNISLGEMLQTQQEKVKKLQWLVCLDESYKEQAIINGRTIFEYENYLRVKLKDDTITVRAARNQLNEPGIVMRVSKELQEKIKNKFLPDIIQAESFETPDGKYYLVGAKKNQITRLVNIIENNFEIEIHMEAPQKSKIEGRKEIEAACEAYIKNSDDVQKKKNLLYSIRENYTDLYHSILIAAENFFNHPDNVENQKIFFAYLEKVQKNIVEKIGLIPAENFYKILFEELIDNTLQAKHYRTVKNLIEESSTIQINKKGFKLRALELQSIIGKILIEKIMPIIEKEKNLLELTHDQESFKNKIVSFIDVLISEHPNKFIVKKQLEKVKEEINAIFESRGFIHFDELINFINKNRAIMEKLAKDSQNIENDKINAIIKSIKFDNLPVKFSEPPFKLSITKAKNVFFIFDAKNIEFAQAFVACYSVRPMSDKSIGGELPIIDSERIPGKLVVRLHSSVYEDFKINYPELRLVELNKIPEENSIYDKNIDKDAIYSKQNSSSNSSATFFKTLSEDPEIFNTLKTNLSIELNKKIIDKYNESVPENSGVFGNLAGRLIYRTQSIASGNVSGTKGYNLAKEFLDKIKDTNKIKNIDDIINLVKETKFGNHTLKIIQFAVVQTFGFTDEHIAHIHHVDSKYRDRTLEERIQLIFNKCADINGRKNLKILKIQCEKYMATMKNTVEKHGTFSKT